MEKSTCKSLQICYRLISSVEHVGKLFQELQPSVITLKCFMTLGWPKKRGLKTRLYFRAKASFIRKAIWIFVTSFCHTGRWLWAVNEKYTHLCLHTQITRFHRHWSDTLNPELLHLSLQCYQCQSFKEMCFISFQFLDYATVSGQNKK